MTQEDLSSRRTRYLGATALLCAMLVPSWSTQSQERSPKANPSAAAEEAAFNEHVQPLIKKYCVRCHDADNMESGIRVDQLTATLEDRQLPLWKGILNQISDEEMPPSDEPQPTAEQRRLLTDWITRAMTATRSRPTPKNGAMRRLTVAQYRNTLRDLLGIQEDLTDSLPPDGTSKDGFTNNAQVLALSPLQVETYFDIAQKALDLCIVDEAKKPVIQKFRMDLGASINPQPCPDKLVLGALSMLLKNEDFIVTELQPKKPFEYQPFAMQTKFEFIEGYVGNDTIRAWKKFDSIYHAVFACVRGTPGYPKGEAVQAVPVGLLLRPAIPSPEIFGQSNTYGPMANFKISLRELPDRGNFRVTVKAARYDDGLLLEAGSPVATLAKSVDHLSGDPRSGERGYGAQLAADVSAASDANVAIPQAGTYQVDTVCSTGKPQGLMSLQLGDRHFAGQLFEPKSAAESTDKDAKHQTAFLIVRLPAGELKLKAKYGDNSRLRRVVFSRLDDDSDLARRFKTFEKRVPSLGVHVGLRRDCGSTLTQVGEPQSIRNSDLREFIFEGAINDFPTPDVEKDNVNYLAGIREIGVRSEYTDGRDMPRLLIRSVEFEGPFYESWPPETHRRIFINSSQRDDPTKYAQDILRSFATRAFRRPVMATELESFVGVWKKSFANQHDAPASGQGAESANHSLARRAGFRQSIKDALLVVLTSPQFLFLI